MIRSFLAYSHKSNALKCRGLALEDHIDGSPHEAHHETRISGLDPPVIGVVFVQPDS